MVYTHTKELLATPPALEPITLAEARAHCRVPDSYTDDDTYLSGLITTARQLLEEQCWSSFVTQAWDFWWSSFDNRMFIPRGPLIGITTFRYRLPNSPYTLTDVSEYDYEVSSEHGLWYARLSYNATWPTSRGHYDDIYMRVSNGYGPAAANVPTPIKHAIKLMVGDLYANREEAAGGVSKRVESRVDSLIGPYRLLRM